jgi:hypothetical protein
VGPKGNKSIPEAPKGYRTSLSFPTGTINAFSYAGVAAREPCHSVVSSVMPRGAAGAGRATAISAVAMMACQTCFSNSINQ